MTREKLHASKKHRAKDTIETYVRGAFGFEDLELHTQNGRDAWL